MSRAASRPYLALRHRDYRRLVASQLFSLVGSQMQTVGINWHIYLLTRSPLALGFAGLTFARLETLWLLYSLNFLSAAAGAFDGPARQSLIPRLVPPEELPGALSLSR